MCYYRWIQGEFTIVPEGNIFLEVWDILMITALFLTAIVVPVEVALLKDPPPDFERLERLLDVIFLGDIVLTFFVAYGVTTTVTHRDMFERAPLKIARRYTAFPFSDNCAAGWFWADTLTIVPWGDFNGPRGIRLVRILRLMRMFRLVRIVKLFKKWHTQFGYRIALLNVIYWSVSTLLVCHWFACLWGHLAMSGEGSEGTWLQTWLNQHQPGRLQSECSALEVYNIALYWSITTLTTVGFGDMEPQNQLEVATVYLTLLVLGILWAWVLAHVVNIIVTMDVFATQCNQLIDDLNLLMEHRGLSPGLRTRCRKHLYESFHVYRQRHQQRTVTWLSAGLQGEIAVMSGMDRVCNCIWYLRGIEKAALIAIAQHFVGDMFSPNEYIYDRYSVSVIRQGTCVRRMRLLTRDDTIGEDMILATEDLVDTVSPRTITFVEVMTLSRNDLVSVCASHVDLDQRVRRAQVRLALWRAIVREASAKKRGRVSLLMQRSPSKRHLRSSPGFSQTMLTVRNLRFSLQESISDVLEQLGALRRRLEETQAVFLQELATMHGRLDELVEQVGLHR